MSSANESFVQSISTFLKSKFTAPIGFGAWNFGFLIIFCALAVKMSSENVLDCGNVGTPIQKPDTDSKTPSERFSVVPGLDAAKLTDICKSRELYVLPGDAWPDPSQRHHGNFAVKFYPYLSFVPLALASILFVLLYLWDGFLKTTGVNVLVEHANRICYPFANDYDARARALIKALAIRLIHHLKVEPCKTDLRPSGCALTARFLLVKILCVAAPIVQLTFLDFAFGPADLSNWTFADWTSRWFCPFVTSHGDSTSMFPVMTFCDFPVNEGPNSNLFTVMCQLRENRQNEVYFSAIWFGLVGLTIVNLFSLLSWIYALFPSTCIRDRNLICLVNFAQLHVILKSKGIVTPVEDEGFWRGKIRSLIAEVLHSDGVLTWYFIEVTVGQPIASELLTQFLAYYMEMCHIYRVRDEIIIPQLDDVHNAAATEKNANNGSNAKEEKSPTTGGSHAPTGTKQGTYSTTSTIMADSSPVKATTSSPSKSTISAGSSPFANTRFPDPTPAPATTNPNFPTAGFS